VVSAPTAVMRLFSQTIDVYVRVNEDRIMCMYENEDRI
jgi:hypothetical protein